MSNNTLKQDDAVFKALDLKVIRRLICKTDKGELELVIRKGETRYFLTLDSVPLEKDQNKELMTILFPVKHLEVPTVNKLTKEQQRAVNNGDVLVMPAPTKKIGRPKGSRDGIKDMQ